VFVRCLLGCSVRTTIERLLRLSSHTETPLSFGSCASCLSRRNSRFTITCYDLILQTADISYTVTPTWLPGRHFFLHTIWSTTDSSCAHSHLVLQGHPTSAFHTRTGANLLRESQSLSLSSGSHALARSLQSETPTRTTSRTTGLSFCKSIRSECSVSACPWAQRRHTTTHAYVRAKTQQCVYCLPPTQIVLLAPQPRPPLTPSPPTPPHHHYHPSRQ
jgi:hypothetical protein